jgi:hypothetical protein
MPLALMVGVCRYLAEGQGNTAAFSPPYRADMHFGRPKMRLVAIRWRLDGALHKVSTSKHTFNHRKEEK